MVHALDGIGLCKMQPSIACPKANKHSTFCIFGLLACSRSRVGPSFSQKWYCKDSHKATANSRNLRCATRLQIRTLEVSGLIGHTISLRRRGCDRLTVHPISFIFNMMAFSCVHTILRLHSIMLEMRSPRSSPAFYTESFSKKHEHLSGTCAVMRDESRDPKRSQPCPSVEATFLVLSGIAISLVSAA